MDLYDLEELAGAALGLTQDQTDEAINSSACFDSMLHEKFGVSLEQFESVADALLPLTPLIETTITKQVHHAFLRYDDLGGCTALARMKPKPIKKSKH